MIKWIVITIFVLIGIFDILLIMGCAKLERELGEYEAYERWKERKGADDE